MLRIGHRGAKGYVTENCLASFQKAIEMGADMIELDVHTSKDAVPVVIHNKTIDSATNGSGLVANYTAKELQDYGIPTLEAVFSLVNNQCEINIEIKEYEVTQAVLDLIDKYTNLQSKLLISSFDWNVLQEVRFHNTNIRIGVLTETDLDLAFSFARFIQAHSIHPYYHLLTAEKTKQIQEKNFKIFTWTVNEPEDIMVVKSFGVDGIITDFLDRL